MVTDRKPHKLRPKTLKIIASSCFPIARMFKCEVCGWRSGMTQDIVDKCPCCTNTPEPSTIRTKTMRINPGETI